MLSWQGTDLVEFGYFGLCFGRLDDVSDAHAQANFAKLNCCGADLVEFD